MAAEVLAPQAGAEAVMALMDLVAVEDKTMRVAVVLLSSATTARHKEAIA